MDAGGDGLGKVGVRPEGDRTVGEGHGRQGKEAEGAAALAAARELSQELEMWDDGALAELEQRASEVERQAQAAAATANRASQEAARAEAVASREPELEANLAAAWKQALSSIAWR